MSKISSRSRTRLAILSALSAVLVLAVAAGANAATPTSFFNGFETDTSGWIGDAQRVATGTNDVPSKTGSWHALAPQGLFTKWNGYSDTFPAAGYSTSVDVYLNVEGAHANDTRFDWDSAVSKSDLSFLRDFVFNCGYYNDSDATGSGARFVCSASNNAGRSGAYPKNPGREPFTVTDTGWYTFQHEFNNSNGVLAAELSILDSSGHALKTWTLSDTTDVIGSTVGGNRYGWFVTQEFPSLAFDNSELTVAPVIVPPTCKTVTTSSGSQLTAAVVNPGDDYAGPLPLSGCQIGVYFSEHGSVKNADIAGATHYGIFADGAKVDVTGGEIHQIGNSPFDGAQNGRAVFYANGATGTVSWNNIYDYQKNGVVATGDKTAVQVLNNEITGRGHLTTIAQNGVVVLSGATGLIKGNSISGNWYTPITYTSYGLLLIDAKGVKQQANSFLDNESNLGNFGRGGGNTNA